MRVFPAFILFLFASSISHAQDVTNENKFTDSQFVVDQKNDAVEGSKVFSYVSIMPEPSVNFSEYLQENLRYPKEAIDKGIQGKVMVKFIVNEDGSLSDIHITKGIGGGWDEEAVRVIKNMPPWKPGKDKGIPVKVYYSQPFNFRL